MMVASYTMEIRQMNEHPLIGVFTFDYDFYSDNPKDKEEFEKLFINWYYFREIGFETPQHFKIRLQAKLNLIMPYYRQLAMTEWDKVKTVELMMTSKNVTDTITHEQSITGNNESSVSGESNQKGSNTLSHQQSTTNEQNMSGSNLADGVAQTSLNDGYLTSVSKATDSGNQNLTGTDSNTSELTTNQSSSGTNNQVLSESTTITSIGDIGIQTPAYAITEWRKVLININQMIIDECNDLFMKIY